MYGGIHASSLVPVAATVGTVAALPATGANTVVTIAATLAVGLLAWGIVYYFRVIRAKAQ